MIITIYELLRKSGPAYSFHRPFKDQGIQEKKLEIDITEKEFDELCDASRKDIEKLCELLNMFHVDKLRKEELIRSRFKFDAEVNKIKTRFKEES